MTSPEQTDESRPWTQLVILLAAIGLPAGTGLAVTDFVVANPFTSAGILLVYWAALWGVSVLSGVAEQAKEVTIGAAWKGLTLQKRRTRNRYLRRLATHIEDIELAGVATTTGFAVGLMDVYIDVSLDRSRPERLGAEPLVTAPGPDVERQSFESALRQSKSKVVALVAGPGSGKTTLLRHTALDLCHGRRRNRYLPILIELRHHAAAILDEAPPALPQLAATINWLADEDGATWFESELDDGGCLVMLDGLDEVAGDDERRAVTAWIKEQISRYPGNAFVLTSRPHGYQSNPIDKADLWRVRTLTVEQIKRFLRRWYATTEARTKKPDELAETAQARGLTRADDLTARLTANPSLHELATNPLLLTMIALVHRYRGALPGSRAALYKEVCDLLLHRRRDDTGLNSSDALSGRQKERITRELAKYMMESGHAGIPIGEAESAIAETLDIVSPGIGGRDFLTDVIHNGLLVEPEPDRIAFAHLSLQEYLTSQAFPEPRQAGGRLVKYIDDPAWREVILLWVASSDATRIIEACLDSGTTRALALAFDCAEQAQEIAYETRQRLERVLDGRPSDPAHRRLITGVSIARSLPSRILTDSGTQLYVTPVTWSMYQHFLDTEEHRHREPDGLRNGDRVTGVWDSDAVAFVRWLNELFDMPTRFRLPTAAELAEPDVLHRLGLEHDSIWVTKHDDLDTDLVTPQVPGDALLRMAVDDQLREARANTDTVMTIIAVLSQLVYRARLHEHPYDPRVHAALSDIESILGLSFGVATLNLLAQCERGHGIACATSDLIPDLDRYDETRFGAAAKMVHREILASIYPEWTRQELLAHCHAYLLLLLAIPGNGAKRFRRENVARDLDELLSRVATVITEPTVRRRRGTSAAWSVQPARILRRLRNLRDRILPSLPHDQAVASLIYQASEIAELLLVPILTREQPVMARTIGCIQLVFAAAVAHLPTAEADAFAALLTDVSVLWHRCQHPGQATEIIVLARD